MLVNPVTFEPADFLTFQWSGSASFEPGFDAVDFSNLQKDPGGDFWMIPSRFSELAPDVGEAADGDDLKVMVTFSKGAVGAQAVALEIAIEGVLVVFCDEDVVEAGVGPTLVPVEERAVFGMVVGPEVAFLCLTGAGLKVVDGCFVSLEVVTGAKLGGDQFIMRR